MEFYGVTTGKGNLQLQMSRTKSDATVFLLKDSKN